MTTAVTRLGHGSLQADRCLASAGARLRRHPDRVRDVRARRDADRGRRPRRARHPSCVRASQRAPTRSRCRSTRAISRSIATPSSCTRCSCRHGHDWRFPVSINRTSRRAMRSRSTCLPAGRRSRTAAETRRAPGERRNDDRTSTRRSRSRRICSRLRRAVFRWRPPSAAAGVPDVPPRDRRAEGGAEPRRDLRSARVGAGVARALHRPAVSVRQVRLRAGPVVPVRRHGASRVDLLQRVVAAARSLGDASTSSSDGPA